MEKIVTYFRNKSFKVDPGNLLMLVYLGLVVALVLLSTLSVS